MPDVLDGTLAHLRAAKRAEDVFGLTDPLGAYRALAKAVHPDHHAADPALASEAMALVNRWWDVAQDRMQRGAYGSAATLFSVTTKAHRYIAHRRVADGDLSVVYDGMRGDDGQPVMLKVSNDPSANAWLAREVQTLRALQKPMADEPWARTVPRLLDHAVAMKRAITVTLAHPRRLYSVADILQAHRGGVDPRDAVWMWKRALGVLGKVHATGRIHGAVLPAHLLVDTEEHGVYLVGWSASVPIGEPVPILSPGWIGEYPDEVRQKQRAGPATDLYMLARVMVRLLGGAIGAIAPLQVPREVPNGMRRFLRACLIPSAPHRLDNAWALHQDIDERLSAWFGRRRFRVFTMPKGV